MKKATIWVMIVIVMGVIACYSDDQISEEKLKEEYYDLLVLVSDLFKDHAVNEENNYYYNQSISSKDDVNGLLQNKVTEKGLLLLIDSIFEEDGNRMVYKQTYQDYLESSRNFSSYPLDYDYYNTVRNTILNPALRLVTFDQLSIKRVDNLVKLEGASVKIDFYEDEERQTEHHQYARYGFPPKDYLDISLTFKVEGNKYLLNDFSVSSRGM